MVRHKLNGIQIEEPIGFDKFKSIIKRTDHHGVSVEMSVGELEFYGQAAEIINEAYDMDVDSELIYLVESSCNGSDYEEEYSGVVELATCVNLKNEYCSIKCKVGEIGVKTTFNNRIETKVDILRDEALDGAPLGAYSNLKKNLTIPAKGIRYTVKSKQTYIDEVEILSENLSGGVAIVSQGFDTNEYSEFDFTGLYQCSRSADFYAEEAAFFVNLSDITGVNVNLKIKSDIAISVLSNSSVSIIKGQMILILKRKSTPVEVVLYSSSLINLIKSGNTHYYTFSFDSDLYLPYNLSAYNLADIEHIAYSIQLSSYNSSGQGTAFGQTTINASQSQNNYFKITADNFVEDSKSDVSFVHESLSRVSEIISGLTVKSDWYGRDDSNVNDTQAVFGGGSLKALVPGFWLRNAVRTNGEEYKFELSFKELISSLNAIDNIGWGFSVENGNLYIRVERWDWFYNNNVVLEINNPKSKKRTINADKIYTRLSVGYEKYGDTNDVNSIDTFHTKREYSTKLKAVDNEVSAISKFVACPYAIEFTRRKSLDKTTEDWRYDENTFIFCIARLEGNYFIETGVTVSDNTIISPETVVNARISPLRNAVRWSDRFFEVNRSIPGELSPLSSTGNAGAKCTPALGYDDVCEDSIVGVGFENQIIEHKQPRLKPETIDIETKLTKTQYNSLKKDPYGIIKVDGESCWLESVERDFNTSESVLKLIPKHE